MRKKRTSLLRKIMPISGKKSSKLVEKEILCYGEGEDDE